MSTADTASVTPMATPTAATPTAAAATVIDLRLENDIESARMHGLWSLLPSLIERCVKNLVKSDASVAAAYVCSRKLLQAEHAVENVFMNEQLHSNGDVLAEDACRSQCDICGYDGGIGAKCLLVHVIYLSDINRKEECVTLAEDILSSKSSSSSTTSRRQTYLLAGCKAILALSKRYLNQDIVSIVLPAMEAACTAAATISMALPADTNLGCAGIVMEECLLALPVVYMQIRQWNNAIKACRRTLLLPGHIVGGSGHAQLTLMLSELLQRHTSDATYVDVFYSNNNNDKVLLGRRNETLMCLRVSLNELDSEEIPNRRDAVKTTELLARARALCDGLLLMGDDGSCFDHVNRFAFEDSSVANDQALALSASKERRLRVLRLLRQSGSIVSLLEAARIELEYFDRPQEALEHARAAIDLIITEGEKATLPELQAKCHEVLGIALSRLATLRNGTEVRRTLLDDALSELEKACQLDPASASSAFHLAAHLADERNTSKALEMVQRSIDLDPQRPATLMLYALLLSASNGEDMASALTVVNGALEAYPDYLPLYIIKAKLQGALANSPMEASAIMLQTYEDAMRQWARLFCSWSSELRPDEQVSSMSLKHIAGAGEARHALGIGSDLLGGLSGLRFALSAAGLWIDICEGDDACTSSTSLLMGADDGSAEAVQLALLLQLWLGIAETFTLPTAMDKEEHQYSFGALPQAVVALLEACELFPASPAVYTQLGRLYEDQGEHQTALKQYQRSVSICPNSASALEGLGRCYEAIGQVLCAEKHLKEAITTGEGAVSHNAWLRLGHVLSKQQHPRLAAQCYAHSIRLERTAPVLSYKIVPRILS